MYEALIMFYKTVVNTHNWRNVALHKYNEYNYFIIDWHNDSSNDSFEIPKSVSKL